MNIWNKAAMSKLLWALAFKSDKLWVQWIHAYYIEGRSMETIAITSNITWYRASSQVVGKGFQRMRNSVLRELMLYQLKNEEEFHVEELLEVIELHQKAF